ncbi:MAG TPA: ABC transporter permease [Acidimicrobiales bacterium]|nr:ABC transporter permease [Acidimicrobiales bacterium]
MAEGIALVHSGFVWLAGVRDLQWRRRRFVIAVLGTSLVMALTLLLTGYQATFDNEIDRTVNIVRADGYLVPKGRPGPFLGGTPFPAEIAQRATELPGITEVSPVILTGQVTDQAEHADIFLVGAQPGALGAPIPKKGRAPEGPGDAVVDTKSGLKIDDTFGISGQRFTVVGTVSGQTYNGGRPTVFLTLAAAQRLMFAGQPFVTTVAIKGTPTSLPDQVTYMDTADAKADLKRPLLNTIESISLFRTLLWIVAAALVGSVIYLSALERVGDFAVFKATGTATGDLLGALIVQAIVLSVSASVLAIGLAYLLRGMFPVQPILPMRIQLVMPLVGLVIGVLASFAALRRAVTVDPALAFGGH